MNVLLGLEAMNLVKPYVPVVRSAKAATVDDAVSAGETLGFPAVIKLISSGLVHKTEMGGVEVAHDEDELEDHARTMLAHAKKKKLPSPTLLIQSFVKGRELLLGLKKDPTFGHVIGLGIGGVFVEVYKDVTWRVCPITASDARQMLDELQGKELLAGVRGAKPVNKNALVSALVKLSHLPNVTPEISELDINPFIINEKEGKAVDVRCVVE